MRKLIILSILTTLFLFIACNPQGIKENRLNAYDMELKLDPAFSTLSGRQTVTYYNNTGMTLENIKFNLYMNNEKFGGIKILNVYGANVERSEITGEGKNILDVRLIKPLGKNKRTAISIDYIVTLTENKLRTGYYDGRYNLANFFPIVCFYSDGFIEGVYYPWGDPFVNEAANFNVKITLPSEYELAHAGQLKNKRAADKNIVYTIEHRKARDFALCAILDGKTVKSSVGGTEVISVAKNPTQAEAALNIAVSAIKTFSEYFTPYPYRTFTVVCTAYSAAGMEYPGLIFIDERLKDRDLEAVIIHETAHQWWYGLVGSDSVNHAWMDEGLAELSVMLYYILNDRRSDADRYRFYAEAGLNSFKELSGYLNISIDMNKSLAEFSSEYEYIAVAYHMAFLMFAEIYDEMGGKAFQRAIRGYIRRYGYRMATPDDLKRVLPLQ